MPRYDESNLDGRRSARGPRLRRLLPAVAGLLVWAGVAYGGLCGDDVGGERVACDCGDVVASDTTLRPGDPITTRRCPMDGLILRADPTTDSVRLDLGGVAIVGSNRGTGLLVERGGSDGAVVVGGGPGRSAEIVGFGTGVHSSAANGLRRLERIHVKGSLHDGFRLKQAGAFLVDLRASDNGGDGFRINGTGGRMIGAVAERNRGDGVRALSRGLVIDAVAQENLGHGIVSRGRSSDLRDATARDNGRSGVVVRATRQSTAGVRAEGNRLGDLRVETPGASE